MDKAPFDVVLVLPYVFSDHPSFPEGLLKRVLEADGFSVGILEQPRWHDPASFAVLGRPRLCFAIVPGPVDSLVHNYTAGGRRRREDLYQFQGNGYFPGSPPSIKSKIRPDRTVMVFANRLRQVWKNAPIVIGGIESSMRRFAHYDFHDQRIRRSILLDSRADILVSGMGEWPLLETCRALRAGREITDIDFSGITRLSRRPNDLAGAIVLPSFEEIEQDPFLLLQAQEMTLKATRAGKTVLQAHGNRFVLSRPAWRAAVSELDWIYGLPYDRKHLLSRKMTPALNMNLFSITAHRGCSGACGFCVLAAHQGSMVISRTPATILEEIGSMTRHNAWQGIVSDIGGPSADMYGKECCPAKSCLQGAACPADFSLEPYMRLLRRARIMPGVKKVFIGSGIRYEALLADPDALEEILREHCGSFLRVAPEHTETGVLKLMKKGDFEEFRRFTQLFQRINRSLRRPIQLRPYLVVGHPGESMGDVREMKKKLLHLGIKQADVQIFTPTPGTMATAMQLTGATSQGGIIPVIRDPAEARRRKYLLKEFFAS